MVRIIRVYTYNINYHLQVMLSEQLNLVKQGMNLT